MKKTIILIALSLMILQSCKKQDNNQDKGAKNIDMTCVPVNLQTGIIAFYSFADGSLDDFSGNNNALTNTTTAHSAPDRNGNNNCAYEFNDLSNSNEFLATTNTTFLDGLNNFSVSLWYQPLDSSRNGSIVEFLIGRGLGNNNNDKWGQWSAALYDCRKAVFTYNSFAWDSNITNFAGNGGCQQEVNIRTGTWHHLAATYSGASYEVKIYRDGIFQNADKWTATSATIKDIGNLFLGKDYTGRLDDVILYNKTLSQAEVTQLSSLGTCCSAKP
jgi:hypothetical protein